jgi:glycosyltransferase involved in cell wall biosynthesis
VTVELMALGKPVLCFIDPELMKYRPDLPIVNVTTATLTDELEKLILDKSLREAIGLQSERYAAKYHDVECIVDDLLTLYGFERKTRVREYVENASMW